MFASSYTAVQAALAQAQPHVYGKRRKTIFLRLWGTCLFFPRMEFTRRSKQPISSSSFCRRRTTGRCANKRPFPTDGIQRIPNARTRGRVTKRVGALVPTREKYPMSKTRPVSATKTRLALLIQIELFGWLWVCLKHDRKRVLP